ncbi:hypothetical protein BC629DRAFT_1594294 [Irpex lacteus]|nr:hypothetical protein BC629DRAFT_1557339 [Irpex lacteus]KAI0782522.1 hypothetical protein BC629DRAFT_1594294 [Irpex lacteus]
MDTIREHARLLYDIFTFNFELDDTENIQRSLGAFVPEELFKDILYWISQDDRTDEVRAQLKAMYPDRPRGFAGIEAVALHEAQPIYTLRSCALVCRYWANQSRRYMFTGRKMHISSLEDAQMFRKYAVNGSPHLFKICDLISELEVKERFKGSRSLLDLIHLPATRNKLTEVQIIGPPPPHIPSLRLDTPHWKLANTVALSPAATSYKTVSLFRLTFPSFVHVIKYLKHFRAATHISLRSLEWSDKTQVLLQRPIPVLKRRQDVIVNLVDCTDGFLIGWQAITMYADSFVHSVVERDQQWALSVMLLLRDYYEQLEVPGYSCSYLFRSGLFQYHSEPRMPCFQVAVQRGPDYPETTIALFHRIKPPSQELGIRGSPKPMRIVGILCDIIPSANEKDLPMRYSTPDLTLLRREIEERCALRIVIFTFRSFEALRVIVESHPALQEPWPRACNYRFVYKRDIEPDTLSELQDWDAGRNWVAIDPVTLEPTGECWQRHYEIAPSLLNGGHQ